MRTERAKVKIIPLGGLNEIGKNITAIEFKDDIVIIDCGLRFPDEEYVRYRCCYTRYIIFIKKSGENKRYFLDTWT